MDMQFRILAGLPACVVRAVGGANFLEWLERRVLFTGGAAPIERFDNGSSDLLITYSNQSVLSGTSTLNGTDFGSAAQGALAVTHTFTIQNIGQMEQFVEDATVEVHEFSHPIFLVPTPPRST